MKYYHIGWSHCGCSSLAEAFSQISEWHPELSIKSIRFGEPIIEVEGEGIRLRDLLKQNRDMARSPLFGLEEYNVILEPEVDHHSDVVPFWQYLAENDGDVKFIVTHREPIDAVESHYKHISENSDGIVVHDIRDVAKKIYDIRYNQTLYLNAIREFFKNTDRLLTMDIAKGDGYEKLLPFLGLSIPDDLPQFPHMNQHDLAHL